ncbi:uncharacterized protein LOC107614206 [Arachis ipaensis]|uniref:Alpha-L-arabinofuranosidase B arabinose-binding domain-containing protein n=1 Tax=Arachis hypogaea TaxID=3818 RepID=A0A444Y8I2_ARAHY|nr:uncharacterized protein LOC107614206 [Arachis ipaensis]XP_025672652.1 uncharacterized protein LOC112771994 isoform X1 [Arachis hypogaea]QHN94928.1 hypothetical protein DS421_18g605250 [Arachis hypogaea]RYQ98205.1 hypothetical protein Ahy_B08g094265 [Arachis hypogaea]
MGFVLVLVSMVLVLGCGDGEGKECTNQPTQSHTFRYHLLTSKNQTRKQEVMSHSRYHLTPIRNMSLNEEQEEEEEGQDDDWTMLYGRMKMKKEPEGLLKEVSLHDVRLHGGSIHGQAQNTNLKYLLMLDVDRLIWSFRKTCGLPTPGTPYGGWEDPTIEVRGHFVGHYLSASALMWASTHNEELKKKMSALVANLSICQQKIGTGYLSAFPSEFFDRFEAIQYVWAPYYTIHKIMAGLLDQHSIAENPQALKMVTWMVDYFYKRVRNVIRKYSIDWHYQTLNEETGGMNDVLYRLYSITGDPKHLLLAHLFDKPCFLGLLAVKANDIAQFHANTHIPVVVGSQMRYEVTGDPLYKEIGTFFMDIVNSSHSYATGGTSVNELWSDPNRMIETLKETNNEESCTTYNMLKVSRNLFRWTKEISYADYYERALTNGVLSIQRGTEPGVMLYYLPQGPGASKAISKFGWGTQFNSFWCCYGTGIESFSKLGDSIYFEEEGKNPSLYIIQYISSSLNWKSAQIMLNQTVVPPSSMDSFLRISLTFSPTKKTSSTSSTLNLRLPTWTHIHGAKLTLNSDTLPLPSPGNFVSITRKWSGSDKLTLQFPIPLRTEAIKDDRPEYASIRAILYGPYLLAGHSTADWDIKTASNASITDWITPIPAIYNTQLFSFYQHFSGSSFILTSLKNSLTMKKSPKPGTSLALHATFRIINIQAKHSSRISTTLRDFIGKSVMLEPFDLPGTQVGSVFVLVSGLDGRNESISLESKSHKGCFVHSGMSSGKEVKIRCKSNSDADASSFNKDASFIARRGLRKYDPISFVAKGANRNFLLEPLLAFRDEHYTVYFNIQE